MTAKISMFLIAGMMLVIQPVFAQDNVITIDLGQITDDELSDALDTATELELIMQAEWELLAEEEPAPATENGDPELDEEEAEELGYNAEEPAYLAAEPEEPAYLAEDPVPAPETEYFVQEPAYFAEEPTPAPEEDLAYFAEEPTPAAEEELAYFAEEPAPVLEPEEPVHVAEDVPESIRENAYFLESLRLVRLAEAAYERGDYDAAAVYAREASRYAQLSDTYIAGQMDAEAVAVVAVAPADNGYTLPATFTVRTWAVYRDCLWNIAAIVYGDPFKWPVLFNANRHIMPDPNNPDWIEPGMVLEIPSIDGEVREGAWQSDRR